MKHRITLIPGDGIGPEVTKPALKIIKAAGVDVEWETCLAGAEALKKHGTTIPKQLLDSFEGNKVALKGPVTTPVGEGFASVNVELRQSFNLYPPSQKATGVNPWMNARWVPSVALAKEGTLRRVPPYELSGEVPRP